jgi:capsular polysaccharide transport system permease protein
VNNPSTNESVNSGKSSAQGLVARIKGLNLLFLFTVVLPTLLSAYYFGFIASGTYISESSFVIRGPEQQAATPLGMILKGTGFTRSQDDGYAVQDFIFSRDALRALDERLDIRKAFSSKNVDIFSRFAGVEWWDDSFEALHKYYKKHVDVQLDSASSVVTLSTRAFTAEDSLRMNQLLFELSEALVNHLNDRGLQDMIRFAAREVAEAEMSAKKAALTLARYRNEKGVIDPERQSAIPLQQIAKMQDDLIATKAQLAQLEMLTKDTPQIPALKRRAEFLEAEIEAESMRVAGGGRQSLASKAAEFQRLSLDKEFSDKQLGIALAALERARNDAQRKQLYMERIAQPSKPDVPTEPRRIKAVLGTVIISLIIWGILSLLVAGIREHYE